MDQASGALPIAQSGLLALTWAGVGIAGLFVIARGVIRVHISTKWSDVGADDYWIVTAFMFLVINGVLQTLQAPHLYYLVHVAQGIAPAGQPLIDHGTRYLKYEFTIIGLFYTVVWCVKASFLAMYWRLFEGLTVWRRCWWAVAIFAFLTYLGAWISSFATCHPPSVYFQFGQCQKPIDKHAAVISIAYVTTVDVLTDILIILLPISLIWNLRITNKAKAGLVAVFCLGLVIIIVAIVRGVEIGGQTFANPIWLAIWGVVESSVAVIVGCLPPFKSLFKFERARSSAAASSGLRGQGSRRRADFRYLQDSEAMSYSMTDNISSYKNQEAAPAPSVPTASYRDEKFKIGSVLLTPDEASSKNY